MARRKERTQTKPQIAPSTPPHASAIDRRQPHPANVFVFRPHLPSPSPKPRSTELRSRLRNIDLHRHRRLLAIGLHRRHLPVIVGFHSPPRSSPAVRPRVCAFASAASPFPDRRRPAAPPPVGSVAAAARLPHARRPCALAPQAHLYLYDYFVHVCSTYHLYLLHQTPRSLNLSLVYSHGRSLN